MPKSLAVVRRKTFMSKAPLLERDKCLSIPYVNLYIFFCNIFAHALIELRFKYSLFSLCVATYLISFLFRPIHVYVAFSHTAAVTHV